MHARVVLAVGKGVLFREVSSIQEFILYVDHRKYKTCMFYLFLMSNL